MKAILPALIGYLILSVIATGIIVQLWLPPGITDRQQLIRLADTDPGLLLWQNLLGAFLGILAGFAGCHFAKAGGLRNPLLIGVLLTIYGIVGIALHPAHPLPMQAAKIVAPVPLALLGGYLRLAIARRGKV
ncbi:hypothetical protein [Solimonas terrae]|uniref:Uncharacterized protein n=1 Tax=Solimonas terrae TaxID=1396819 RepID=A0A6M2BYF0_9GAMM|nr:hypothetical protein [Solimonas terrae]NGY06879.1 hypothetical protein [Solimonas terrae]